MNRSERGAEMPSTIVGAGLVVLDVIIRNGDRAARFNAGGTCGNVLAGLSFLGWRSTVISRVGNDLAGRMLLQDLSRDGVDTRFITVEQAIRTPRIVERLNSNGRYADHRFLLTCPACGAYLPRFRSPRIDSVESLCDTQETPSVYFFDRVTPSTLRLARAYREAGALIFFEPSKLKPNDKMREAIRLCHVLKYSSSQVTQEVKAVGDSDGTEIAEPQGHRLTIQTMGQHGLSFRFTEGDQWCLQSGFRIRRLYDPCGAGDWCTVGFLFRLQELALEKDIKLADALQSKSVVDSSLRFAQMLSSLSCVFVGARGLSKSMDRIGVLKTVRMRLQDNADASAVAGTYATRCKRGLTKVLKTTDRGSVCPVCLLPRDEHGPRQRQ